MSEENTSLVPLNQENAVEYFRPNGLDPILQSIKEQASKLVPDTSTDEGRKKISSNARKVASAKVALDNIRKELVSGEKARLKAIDAEGSRAWDILETLQKDVRKPLDEWEAIDEKRVNTHKENIDRINSLQICPGDSVPAIEASIKLLEAYRQKDFEEFADLAQTTIDNVQDILIKKLDDFRIREAERAELDRLRKEAAEREEKDRQEKAKRDEEDRKREQAEREERIRQDAIAETERKSQEKIEQDRKESERKAQAEIDKAKRDKEDSDRLAENAVAQQKASEEKSERDRIAAEKKAKDDQEAAVQAERDRQEQVRVNEAVEAAKREANKKHLAKIHNEIVADLCVSGLSEAKAKEVVIALAQAKIRNVKIVY